MIIEDTHGQAGDVFVGNPHPPIITIDTRDVANATGAVMVLEPGHPMAAAVPVTAAGLGAATVNGLVWSRTIVPDGETAKVPVYSRGDLAVNQDALPLSDYAGDDYVQSTLRTKITAGLTQVVLRQEPPMKATHLT